MDTSASGAEGVWGGAVPLSAVTILIEIENRDFLSKSTKIEIVIFAKLLLLFFCSN